MIGSIKAVTATVSVHWRATPAAYTARVPLLRALEGGKRLRAFTLEEETARARIDRSTEVILYPNKLVVTEADGLPDRAMLTFLFEQLTEQFQPDITQVAARFQHLVPVPRDYDEARRVAAAKMFGPFPQMGVTDFAVLLDGVRSGSSKAPLTYKAEFGVVTAQEAPLRLSQAMGRVRGLDHEGFDPDQWNAEDLPPVALYVDSSWHEHRQAPKPDVLGWTLRRPDLYAREAEGFVRQLVGKLGLATPTGARAGDQDEQ